MFGENTIKSLGNITFIKVRNFILLTNTYTVEKNLNNKLSNQEKNR